MIYNEQVAAKFRAMVEQEIVKLQQGEPNNEAPLPKLHKGKANLRFAIKLAIQEWKTDTFERGEMTMNTGGEHR